MPNLDREILIRPAVVEADMLTWMGVHGCVLLALKHPEYTGPSRKIVERFVDGIGKLLVQAGIFSQEEYDALMAADREQWPT
jgi:hypothetical protein